MKYSDVCYEKIVFKNVLKTISLSINLYVASATTRLFCTAGLFSLPPLNDKRGWRFDGPH